MARKNIKKKADRSVELEPGAGSPSNRTTERTSDPATDSALESASETESSPVSPPQRDPNQQIPQTSWRQVIRAVIIGLIVGVVLSRFLVLLFVYYSTPGGNTTTTNISDVISLLESYVVSSANAQRDIFGVGWAPWPAMTTRKKVNPTRATTKPTTRRSQATTETTVRSTQSATKSSVDYTRLAWDVMPKMDKSVKPCEDFYNYACGRLMKNPKIPDGKDMVNTFTELNDRVQDQLLSLVREKIDQNEATFLKAPRHLYQLCMNKPRIDRDGIAPLFEILDTLGGWPILAGNSWNTNSSWSWVNSVKKLRMLGYPTDYFFDVSVKVDSKKTSRRFIYIDRPNLSIKSKHLAEGTPEARVYLNYTIDMTLLLAAAEAFDRREVRDSVIFELALARIALPKDERQDPTSLYTSMSVNELQSKYRYVDWLEYFKVLFTDTGIVVDENEIVIVRNPRFMEKLGELLAITSNRTLANYIMRRVINFSASFLPENLQELQIHYRAILCDKQEQEYRCLDMTTKSLPDIDGSLYIRKHLDDIIRFSSLLLTENLLKLKLQYTGVLSEVRDQQHHCLDVVIKRLPISVGALYIRRYFNDGTMRAVLDIVKYIKIALEEILSKLEWMDYDDRVSALEKFDAIVYYIGYPDELLDDHILNEYYKDLKFNTEENYLNTVVQIDRFTTTKKFSKLRHAVNKPDWTTRANQAALDAFYNPTDNTIHFPASYFQDKLFSLHWPNYMNYGAIGSVIGREITRGFYDLGRQFDHTGKAVDWWQLNTTKNFEKMAICLMEQYNNYTEPNVNLRLSGFNTLAENIADHGGIKIAYYAYKKWAEKNGPEPPLRYLGLPAEQMFWLTAAQTWFAAYRPEMLRKLIASSEIAPAQFRVLGSMSNMVDFSEDFNCPSGTPMNRTGKCNVWKGAVCKRQRG